MWRVMIAYVIKIYDNLKNKFPHQSFSKSYLFMYYSGV